MATSGSTDFNQTALEIVTGAFRLLGVLAQEQLLESPERADGFAALNLMVKGWQAQRLHLWTKEEGILFLQVGKTDYFLGVTGNQATRFDDFISTTLTATAAASATTLVVADTTGMVALDTIGIELDDGTRQWTTIVSVDSATGLTITTALTSAASSANTIYTYTTQIERPLRILGVRRGKTGEDTEVPVIPFKSRSEYFNQNDKTSQGTVINYYYSPVLPNGRMYIWQTADNIRDIIRFTYERPIEDFDSNSNDPDFPVEWTEVIKFNLAARLGLEYTTSPERYGRIVAQAEVLLDDVLGFDLDNLSLSFQPSIG